MSSELETSIPINLMGKNFSIKCRPDQVQALEQSVAFLKHRLTGMRAANNESNLESLLFIASLNLVNEIIHGDDSPPTIHINQQLSNLIKKVENQLTGKT
jgi:cell division protein ZapA (FtsZ GTPase activity inhibitor)